ncbi:putative ribonuclease H-like domain-containing protein [Tanacetum coccineum]
MMPSTSQEEIPPPPPPPPSSSETPTQPTPHTVSTIKLPILKKGEYDIWAMKIEHYLAHTDYLIWEVIQNGNSPVSITTDTSGQIKVLPPRTFEELLPEKIREKQNHLCGVGLMDLQEDHLAKCSRDQDNRRRDAWNSGNKDGSRSGQKEDSKALVTVDGEGVDWITHSKDEDYALMACNSLDSDTEVCKRNVIVSPPMTSTDSSELVTKPVVIKSSVESQPKVWSDAPIIEEYELDSDDNDYPHRALKNKGIVDSGCSRHMTGNKAYLDEFQDFNGGPVAFGGSKGHITGKGGLACLIAKATTDESNKWHRRLGHVNFKNLNKLVKGNLVRGLPSKIFQNDHTCVACQKGKQHKASYKAKAVSSISQTLQLLHMDLFGPTSVRSLNHKTYCLVITDDFSRFSWVFFLRTKDETSAILKDFIRQIENQLNQKVKTIRSDNGTEFKNKEVIEFYGIKGIKREYSNARTPQQNGVAERKNRTLIEAARTMLADSFLPNTFWAEAVSTACYVLNRVLVTKPHNKTPYELLTEALERKLVYSMQEELVFAVEIQKVFWVLEEMPYGKKAIENDTEDGTIDKTLFLKKDKHDNHSSQVYVMISTLDLQRTLGVMKFEALMKSSISIAQWESLLSFLELQFKQKPDGIFYLCLVLRFQVTPKTSHLSAVKRIFRKSTTGGCQFLGRRLISWQCKKQTIVATSTTEAEYVAAASCCGQVLWIQNQMLDYGFNFMNTKIYIDNESTICIVKNPVYHSKTKHIAIRHHFIRDAYEKKLIQVLKIHTDDNVADLLTKAFDVSRKMAVLDSCPKHNMVAYLEKSKGNVEVHEIIDFLKRSSIHHALTERCALQKGPSENTTYTLSAPTSEVPHEPQTDLLPAQTSEKLYGENLEVSDRAKESVSNKGEVAKGKSSVQRDPLFDENTEDTVDHMETENTQDEGRTREMVDEDNEIDENTLISTEDPKSSTDRQIKGTDEHIEPLKTYSIPTSIIFGDDETIAKVLLNMSQAKAVSREKEKGVELKDIEEADKPRPTSTRSLLTLKPLPKIDPKDKGKKKIEEEDESEKKDKKSGEGRKERNRIAEEKATNEALIRNFDDIKARIEADRLLAEKLQEQEREQFTIEERAKFLHDTIAAQRRFLAQQRSEAIRNRPPTKNQLRNQMMTYLKHVGNFKHAELKIKKFEEVKLCMRRYESTLGDLWFVQSDDENEFRMHSRIGIIVKKKYPLRKKVLMQMLKLKLESEEDSTMALELIRFIKKILEELEPEG